MSKTPLLRAITTTLFSGLIVVSAHAQDTSEEVFPESVDLSPSQFLEPAPSRFRIGAFGGTTGLGGLIKYDLTEKLYLQGQIGGLALGRDFEIDGVNYDSDISLFSAGMTVNYLPFSKGLRFSAGLSYVDNTLDISASDPGAIVNIGFISIQLGERDTLDGDVTHQGIAPYLGVGFDHAFGADDNYEVALDLGVLFVGEPDVDLQANGPFANLAEGINLDAELDREVDDIREEFSDFQFFPVVSLSFTYRF